MKTIDRWDRKIASFDSGSMAHVAFGISGIGIPRALHGIDRVAAAVHVVVPTRAVEDEKFVLGAKQCTVGNAGRFQVSLGALAERARVALVTLHGGRLDDVATDIDGGVGEE